MRYTIVCPGTRTIICSGAKPFRQLDTQETAPTLPYGYQTMALIALTPRLRRHIMRPLLVDWDARFVSDAEREVVRERSWEGVA